MKYHFIGIKGTGMSALAIILKKLGNDVDGSDLDKHFFTESGLVNNDIKFYTYDAKNILDDYIIIKGASILENNIELMEARKRKLKIYEYNEMVGELSKKFKTICIAGCHGKTTTTKMMSMALDNINYLIGDGSGDASIDNEFFALESCEYRRHFLAYYPYYAVITNIDLDHVDYYKDIDDVISAYREYADRASKMVVMYGDDLYIDRLNTSVDMITFGLSDKCDIRAININYNKDGISFDVNNYGHFNLPIYGEAQLLDALAVISVCYLEKIDASVVNNRLSKFRGAKRRFNETIIGNNIVIDDYAHHPNEVKAVIEAVKQKYPDKDIVGIFQPHTFSRTKEFASDLVKIFKDLKASYVLDIHPARELQEDYPDITSNLIIDKLDNCYHINIEEYDKLTKYDNTVFIFMSPNDISKLEDDLKKNL